MPFVGIRWTVWIKIKNYTENSGVFAFARILYLNGIRHSLYNADAPLDKWNIFISN